MKGGEKSMVAKNFFCLRCANRLGLLFMFLFVLCFAGWWRLGLWDTGLRELHADLLRLAFMGFDDFNVKSFLLGLLQSYVWAYIGVFLWHIAGCCGVRNCKECKK